MTHPSDPTAPAGQPGTPDGAWAPPQGGATSAPYAEPQKSGGKKWLAIGGAVLAAGVIGIGALGLFGSGTSEVGDCIQTQGETSYEVVDCDSDEAEFTIVGIDDQELTYSEFEKAPGEELCTKFFQETEYVLWEGEMVTEPGTIYCAAAV